MIESDMPCTSCCHCCADAVSAVLQSAKKRKKKSAGGEEAENGVTAAAEPVQPSQTLTAESYTPPDPGPYPQDKPPENPVRFTPVQVHTYMHLPVCSPHAVFAHVLIYSVVDPCTYPASNPPTASPTLYPPPPFTPPLPLPPPPPPPRPPHPLPQPASQPMARQPCLFVLCTLCISYPVTLHGPTADC